MSRRMRPITVETALRLVSLPIPVPVHIIIYITLTNLSTKTLMVNRFILNEVSYFGPGARKELPGVSCPTGFHQSIGSN